MESVRGNLRAAWGEGYIDRKVGEEGGGDGDVDMGGFFDRLVARLVVLKV